MTTGSPIFPERNVWQRFWSHKTGRFFFLLLGLMYLGAFFAPFLAPYNESSQRLTKAWHPPTPIVWHEGRLAVQETRLVDKATRDFQPIPDQYHPIRFFIRGAPYRWLGIIPSDLHLFGVPDEGRIYLLGSDGFGRCVFSRVLYGAQISMSIGLVGITITTVLGLLFGGIAGYFSGWTDTLIMRLTEVMMAVPGLYMILALRSVFSKNMSSGEIYLMVIVIMGLVSWSGAARVIRGMTLSIRERDFIRAAQALGQHPVAIIVRHVIPNTFSYVVVSASLAVPGYILGEASLSFLGLGIQDPSASWGLMLASAQNIRVLVNFWWMLVPAFLIILTVLSFNFVGDALRDAVDPRLRTAR